MKYNGLTSVGSIYQAKCAANNIPVKFVKVKVGNGLLEETENPLNFTDIKSLKKEVGISEITQINEAVRLTVPLDNDGVTEGYYPREFGIYVEDDGVEVLYWYINDGQEASYLPPQSSAPVKIKNHFNIIATSLESLIVNWDGKEFWVDKEYLGKELEKKEDKIEIKESAFNRSFGTLENEVLEGIQLARILGLEYGGELNNSNTKKLNTVYYDTQNKSFFKCFQENSLNYADSNYYEGISNNDLLLKLQNLDNMLKASEIVKTYKEQWFYITEYANGDKVLLGEYRINEGDGNVENAVALPVWATNANAREAQCYLVGALPQTQHISTFTIYGNTLHILYGGSGLAVGAYVRFLIRFNKI